MASIPGEQMERRMERERDTGLETEKNKAEKKGASWRRDANKFCFSIGEI